MCRLRTRSSHRSRGNTVCRGSNGSGSKSNAGGSEGRRIVWIAVNSVHTSGVNRGVSSALEVTESIALLVDSTDTVYIGFASLEASSSGAGVSLTVSLTWSVNSTAYRTSTVVVECGS